MRLLRLHLVILCSTFFVASASAQSVAYSKPAGFVTHTLKAEQLNLIGLTLHEPVVYSGSFDEVEGLILRDINADYDAALTSGNSYVLEIVDNPTDPSLNGVIQVITDWTTQEITTTDDLTGDGLVAGAKYNLRAPKTISDVFGSSNSAGLTAGANMASADVIWLHNGVGFDKFYYSEGGGFGGGEAGWKDDSGADAGDFPIIYTDAVIIQNKALTDKKLVVSGVVKTKAVTLALMEGKFNFISSTYPVGSTLGNSGLEADLVGGVDKDSSDVVWMPNDEGGYDQYYYSTEGWKDAEGQPASETLLTSGIIIERIGDNANAKLTPPEAYNDL
jgi:hypothetical protein